MKQSELSPIKKTSIIEESVRILRDYILNGDLGTDDYLPSEMVLCKQLGIGRSTLREAVKIMESQGLVEKQHGVGVRIVDNTHNALSDLLHLMVKRKGSTMVELMEVRYVNEIRTTELAAENATKEDIENIKKQLEIMRNSMATTSEYIEADINFHLAISKASHNEVFHLILKTIRPLLEEMISETLKSFHRPERSMKYHEKIYNAIVAGDPEKAVSAMKEHLQGTRKMINTNNS